MFRAFTAFIAVDICVGDRAHTRLIDLFTFMSIFCVRQQDYAEAELTRGECEEPSGPLESTRWRRLLDSLGVRKNTAAFTSVHYQGILQSPIEGGTRHNTFTLKVIASYGISQ